MKIQIWVMAVLFCLGAAGCKKSNQSGQAGPGGQEAKIEGKASDAPVEITPKWKPGQRYVMRMESAQTMQMPNVMAGRGAAPGGTSPMENNFAQEYALTVTNSPGPNRGMELEILAIELQTGFADQQQLNYDSRNKVARDAGPITEAFDRVIGGRVRFLISPENKVVKVEGVQELFEKAEGADAAPATDPAQPARPRAGAAGGVAMLRSIYSEEVLKQMIEMSSGPDHPVRIGESWTVNREINQPAIGKMLLAMTNTLRGWQEHEGKKCARVEFTGVITGSGEGASGGPIPMRMSLENGTLSGHSWFSPELSLTVDMSIQQNYVLKMTPPAGFGRRPPNGAGNNAEAETTFAMPVKQNVSVRLLEAKAATE
jgi:hypothetical protein